MRNLAKEFKEAKNTRTVNGYHYSRHQSLKIYTSDRYRELTGKDKGYGLEIELSCNWINVHDARETASNAIGALLQEVVFKEFPADLVRYEKDCSITGAECVTQCMTKEFIRNHYAQFKNLFDVYLPRFGMTPNDHCGMHVNISLAHFGNNEQKRLECTRKLFYFINRYFIFSCRLLGRNPSETRYCDQMDWENARHMNPARYGNSHGVSFNLGHYDEGDASRIELRIVGGQRTFAQFRNTMEVVFHLISRVKEISWNDLDNFEKVFEGCNKYVLSRLDLCRENGCITADTYENIKAKSDTETSYL